jgi:hypothetical protein
MYNAYFGTSRNVSVGTANKLQVEHRDSIRSYLTNPLKTKIKQKAYTNVQFVPLSKHTPIRLYKPVS